MPSALFSPIDVGGLSFPNRIAVAPMCQYSAADGSATDWHLQHWMNLAMSGAGMITVEATAVERRGRITYGDLGLYCDENEATVQRTLAAARRVAAPGARFGVQLAHAGRKASTQRPWEGGGPLSAEQDAWQTVAPSALPFAPGWHVPEALDEAGIERLIGRFAEAARRAERAGFEFAEIHGAHGYLIHEFLSPLSNHRTDRWGGSLENRMRLIVEIARAIRAAVSPSFMVGARLSATEWVDGGFTPEESVAVSKALKAEGVAYIDASTAGNTPDAKIPVGPLYQVEFAEKIKREAGIVTRAVGMIDDPKLAESIIADGRADMVAVARALLADPRWPWRAASVLGEPFHAVVQYERSASLIRKWTGVPRAS
ncbi:2,4-dienoyl-CoA reductase [Faunimonas pinastri]|uniref:2,4-dienoyl-CoA reductase n=1 Tax=Faunimonas pinastri TaxID=1855383 RepID=A0A1H9NL91_9HYPH|nr:NADH:flavin oxidoreductase/NADH oxidase [Faunimonas pinastri]SER36425.1 2,4-dienoyl-CoA reductase [Faunimonas pinastri]